MFTEIAESQVTVGAEAPKEPGDNRGCRCAFPLEHVWFSSIHWCGYQTCPWDCSSCLWSDLDFRIENERVGGVLKGPGLIVHLIREHQFFEGSESPYRVDPMRLVQVLGVITNGLELTTWLLVPRAVPMSFFPEEIDALRPLAKR